MNPDSLCGQVLKAKYFQNSDLLNATEASGISYTWRSILRGIKALKNGLIWRVGDGNSINIWLDPWIPRGVTRMPITPRGQTLITRVADLIDPVTGDWDQVLVRDVFWEEDVQNILAIPDHMGRENVIAWHYDRKRVFSVKSGYHILHDLSLQRARKQKGESSNMQAYKRIEWKHVWRLDCAPRIKHFLWRLAHNSLPLQMNIKKRGMEIDTRCPVCWRLNEDGGHCFLKCKFVVKCWREATLENIRTELLRKSSAAEVVGAILSLQDDVRLRVIMLLFSWWEARNKTNAGEGIRSPGQVVHRVAMLVMESRPARTEVSKTARPADRWTRPPLGILKINCDGAFFAETKTGGWGFVIRDHNSHAILAGSGSLGAVHDADCTEAQACIAALQAASSHGMGNIILESDSMNTVKALQSNERDRSPASVLYKEARELISLCFDSVQVSHIPRSCNRSAHELARLNLGWDPDQPHVWFDPLPSFVSDFVVRDCAEPNVNE